MDDQQTRAEVAPQLPRRASPRAHMATRADAVTLLGRRFAPGDLMPRLARTVGRTSRLSVAGLLATLRELGPYTALALVLPGGSLIALAAWAFRHRTRVTASVGRLVIVGAAFAVALILPVSA